MIGIAVRDKILLTTPYQTCDNLLICTLEFVFHYMQNSSIDMKGKKTRNFIPSAVISLLVLLFNFVVIGSERK